MNILKISVCILLLGFCVNSFAKPKMYSYHCPGKFRIITKPEKFKTISTRFIQCTKTFRMERYRHTNVRLFCSSPEYPCAYNVSKQKKSGLYCLRHYNLGPPNHIVSSCENRSRHTYHPTYTFTCAKKRAGSCFYSGRIIPPPNGGGGQP